MIIILISTWIVYDMSGVSVKASQAGDQGLCMILTGASDQGLRLILTGASPVTTFLAVLMRPGPVTDPDRGKRPGPVTDPDRGKPCHYILAVLRLKCSDTPCGYQDRSESEHCHSFTVPWRIAYSKKHVYHRLQIRSSL